jgi:hypothetical protein
VGHRETIVVGDCGLTPRQRELLAPHCTLFALPSAVIQNPTQYKPFPYLLNPAGTVVVIDSDMIVTKNLASVLASAGEGKICVFPDPEKDRWFGEWQEIFGLSTAPRRQLYGCAGFVAFSTAHWPRLLELWWQACVRISAHPTYQEGARDGPTSQADSDAFNALMMSEFPADAAAFLPFEEQVFRWDFRAVEVIDARTLRCRYQEYEPAILHAVDTPKPWQRAGVRQHVYLQLLRRLLTAPDLALNVPLELLPIWLRPGPLATAVGYGLSFANMTNPKRAISLARRLKKRFA